MNAKYILEKIKKLIVVVFYDKPDFNYYKIQLYKLVNFNKIKKPPVFMCNNKLEDYTVISGYDHILVNFFFERITKLISDDNLGLLKRNIETLAINKWYAFGKCAGKTETDLKPRRKFLGRKYNYLTDKEGGFYCGDTNEIFVFSKYKTFDILLHELLHMASCYYNLFQRIAYSGFCQRDKLLGKEIGFGLDEGYTEHLTYKICWKHLPIESCYFTEVQIVRALEEIIGQEKMEKLYFNADLYGLINELKKYLSEEDAIKFILTVDEICALHKNEEMKDIKYRESMEFISKCRDKKNSLLNTEIDVDDNNLDFYIEEERNDRNI